MSLIKYFFGKIGFYKKNIDKKRCLIKVKTSKPRNNSSKPRRQNGLNLRTANNNKSKLAKKKLNATEILNNKFKKIEREFKNVVKSQQYDDYEKRKILGNLYTDICFLENEEKAIKKNLRIQNIPRDHTIEQIKSAPKTRKFKAYKIIYSIFGKIKKPPHKQSHITNITTLKKNIDTEINILSEKHVHINGGFTIGDIKKFMNDDEIYDPSLKH